ncbi:MAG: ABC transporter ATP-binding protein [Flavisolibacter sp.]
MKIKLSKAGKRFNREWIFRNAELEWNSGNAYAITGPNGSGKSTLLQCVGGMFQLNEGDITFSKNNKPLAIEEAYKSITFCAPYMDVIEEMTLEEFFQFHNKFKSILNGFSIDKIISEIDLERAGSKQIRNFSSGMKQRVKLAQAILFDADIILLDEPCTNLDEKGIALYHSLINNYCKNRLVVVCSNDKVEYSFCNEIVNILDLKSASLWRKER